MMTKREMAVRAIIDAWHADKFIPDAARAYTRAAEIESMPVGISQFYAVIGANPFTVNTKVKIFIARNTSPLQKLSAALWDGRQTDACVSIGIKCLGGNPRNSIALPASRKRANAAETDWKTCKQ